MKSVTENLLRPQQANNIKEDITRIRQTLSSGHKLEDRGQLARDMKRSEEQLNRYCPEQLTGAEKDDNALRIKDLEREIVANMPSTEMMRKNPAGAVHKNTLWNRFQKGNVLEWKNRKLQQEPDSEDPDLANVEILRPSRPVTLDTTAQIPGHHAMSAQAKENFGPIFPESPTSNTALKQVKDGRRRTQTKEHLEKMRQGRIRAVKEREQALDHQVVASKASEGD